ncbi:MAG: hypothetical protein ACYS8W_05935 [Planctomycetota bacterium]
MGKDTEIGGRAVPDNMKRYKLTAYDRGGYRPKKNHDSKQVQSPSRSRSCFF